MIRNSYIFLEGINEKTEKSIWQQGISSWADFLKKDKIDGISQLRKLYYDRQLKKALYALFNSDSGYFVDKMPKSESWRLYEFFKEDAIFLDIEVSGITANDDITVFGIFDGINTKTMIAGINLDIKALQKELLKYKLIVTFNGSVFDLPFVKRRYPGLIPKIPCFDLRHACAKIGLTGGLKAIEKEFGIKRSSIVGRFYSGDPYTLWRMHRATGDDYYLNLLVEYNEEDVVNLKTIANFVYQRLKNESRQDQIIREHI